MAEIAKKNRKVGIKKPDLGPTLILQASDGKKVHVKEKSLKQCKLFDSALAFTDTPDLSDPIEVKDVKCQALKIVVEFCGLHADDPPYESPKNGLLVIPDVRHEKLFNTLNHRLMTEVILAANYVENQRLIDALMIYLHRRLRGLNLAGIRKTLNLHDDLTDEEKSIFSNNNDSDLLAGILNQMEMINADDGDLM